MQAREAQGHVSWKSGYGARAQRTPHEARSPEAVPSLPRGSGTHRSALGLGKSLVFSRSRDLADPTSSSTWGTTGTRRVLLGYTGYQSTRHGCQSVLAPTAWRNGLEEPSPLYAQCFRPMPSADHGRRLPGRVSWVKESLLHWSAGRSGLHSRRRSGGCARSRSQAACCRYDLD